MTKHEFLYDHDERIIIDLINRKIELMTGSSSGTSDSNGQVVKVESTNARDFF